MLSRVVAAAAMLAGITVFGLAVHRLITDMKYVAAQRN